MCFTVELSRKDIEASGADAVGGHTRSHPEHDGKVAVSEGAAGSPPF